MNTYYIGGSPCSGKSTITAICQKQAILPTEIICSRDPLLQCDEIKKRMHQIQIRWM